MRSRWSSDHGSLAWLSIDRNFSMLTDAGSSLGPTGWSATPGWSEPSPSRHRSGWCHLATDGISEISGYGESEARRKLAEEDEWRAKPVQMSSRSCGVAQEMQKSSGSCRVAQQIYWKMRCDPVIPYTFIPWPKVKAINSSGASRDWGQLHCETLPFSSAEACHGQTWTLLEGRSEVCKPRWTSGAASRGTIDLCYFTYRMALEEILKPGFVPAWWDLSKRTSILTRFPQLFSRRRGVSQPFLPQTNGFSFTI
jgi:hypothetical protein